MQFPALVTYFNWCATLGWNALKASVQEWDVICLLLDANVHGHMLLGHNQFNWTWVLDKLPGTHKRLALHEVSQ